MPPINTTAKIEERVTGVVMLINNPGDIDDANVQAINVAAVIYHLIC